MLVSQGTLSVTAVRKPVRGTRSKKTPNSFLTKLIARNGNETPAAFSDLRHILLAFFCIVLAKSCV